MLLNDRRYDKINVALRDFLAKRSKLSVASLAFDSHLAPNKVVTDNIYDISWVNLAASEAAQITLLAQFRATSFRYRYLHDFFQDTPMRIVALHCVFHSEHDAPTARARNAPAERRPTLRRGDRSKGLFRGKVTFQTK